ncbi:MAG: FAD-binding protein [Alphaproteobacteria bacterium]|nr:FAD-binding protein [Alphaproteobacteria bacterium]
MERYDPQFMDLACRDVITRAVAQEIAEGRGCGEKGDHVLLSLEHLSSTLIYEKLPHVVETTRNFKGIDPTITPIPVAPTAHYTMGGIPTNINGEVLMPTDEGMIPVRGLFALGEAACSSVHGANRLGCNSLLDLMVFGKRVPHYALNTTDSSLLPNKNKSLAEQAISQLDRLRLQKGPMSLSHTRQSLMTSMQHYVGVYRHRQGLQHNLTFLNELAESGKSWHIGDSSLMWNTQLLEALELENMLLLSLSTTSSALRRQESRGAHYRSDFPQRDDNQWRVHSLISVSASHEFHYKTTPVRTTCMDPLTPTFTPPVA